MKHVSWIVALVVGVAIGWVVRSAMGPTGGGFGGFPSGGAGEEAARVLPQRPQQVLKATLDGSPVRGPADALVTIVISSDFQCPFCKRGYDTEKQIEREFGSKVRFAFKHNPLPMHPRAIPAANLAEFARAQGGDAKFWQVHDALFEEGGALDDAALEKIARDAGLDPAKAKEAIAADAGKARIDQDQALSQRLGAMGTPGYWVNGRFVYGAQPFEVFKRAIQEELSKAEGLVAAGTPAAQVYDKIMATAILPPAPPPRPTPAAAAPAAPLPPGALTLRPDDPVRGNPRAPVTVVVFSDFQCPFCGRFEPTLAQIAQTYKDKVRIVWKHEPLPMHPNAIPAALAAEAARQQGKFWEMHDKLFSNQGALSDATYDQYARELGLDLARFQAARRDPALLARIQQDQALGMKIGANGTPTSFVNGEPVVGALPFEMFQKVIDRQLAAAAAKPVR